MKKSFLTLSHLRLVMEVLLITVLLSAGFTHQSATQAAAPQGPESPQAVYWYVCNGPNHIGLFTDRVHVYCASTTPINNAPALTGIYWFAVPTSPDSAGASRTMSLLQTAVITSRPIWLQVNPTDTSGTSFGCGAGDCRRFTGMEMR